MDSQTVITIVVAALVVYSISLHELSHAWAATVCGDPTPGRAGRLTWNPLVQLHWLYSVVMPLVSYLLAGWPFGFAYTPIDPSYFRHPLRDRALVGLAGPAANFLMMGLFIGLLWIPGLARPQAYNLSVFSLAAFWNLLLGVFNLLPMPGLDGYDVLRPALPLALRQPLDNVRNMGFLPLILVFVLGPRLFPIVFTPFVLLFLELVPGPAAEVTIQMLRGG